MIEKGRYQLRHAAGMYWLLDMKRGMAYDRPFWLNDCGACILRQYLAGVTEEEIAEWLQAEYGLLPGEAADDVRSFLEQLDRQGITDRLG